MKNSITPIEAIRTNSGYCIASVELAAHLLGARPLLAQASPAPGRACPTPRRPGPVPHTSAETAPDARRRLGKALAAERAQRAICQRRGAIGRRRHRRRAVRGASSSRAPAFNSKARSRVKVVTSARPGRSKTQGRWKRKLALFSSTVSIGNSRKYSMRAATSVAVGADSTAVDDLAGLCQRAIAEIRHLFTSPRGGDAEDLRGAVNPARHLARPSSSIVVMPPRIAA